MKYDDKRRELDELTEVQADNQAWWTAQTMSYDWQDPVQQEKYTLPWYEEVDRRFIRDSNLFATKDKPFDQIMPLADLKGKRVLEIGCGMGLHSETLARAGAILTSIDLSPTSVMSTSRRFELKGIDGDIRQMDAEHLEFPDNTFDLVWSWGVIHHSSHTGRVIREIHRVLKPGGEVRIMVYNLSGMPAYITMMTVYSWAFWRGKTIDECLWASTDGATARFYTRDSLGDVFRIFFNTVKVSILGQLPDAVPFPRQIRGFMAKFVSEKRKRELVRTRGAYLFVEARKD